MGTKELTVQNVQFAVLRLAAECTESQYVRELTKNGFESGATSIEWQRHDWQYSDGKKVKSAAKISVADNGCGMDPTFMIDKISGIFASGHVQSDDANFGVGAKISTIAANPAGVVYRSWQDGIGHQVWLWKDPVTGVLGLREFGETDDGEPILAQLLTADDKPDLIDQHGTQVILLGETEASQTYSTPSWSTNISAYGKYLNSRFFRIPDGVDLRYVVLNQRGKHRDGSNIRRAYGMESFLSGPGHADASGVVELSDAKVHWWIIPEGFEWGPQNVEAKGHVAALYQDELYEFQGGHAGRAQLQHFGVLFGTERVVLYVEPDAHPLLYPNTARTALLVNGEPIPWSKWATEFRELMPDEIAELQSSNESPSDIERRQRLIDTLMRHVHLFAQLPLGTSSGNAASPAGPRRTKSTVRKQQKQARRSNKTTRRRVSPPSGGHANRSGVSDSGLPSFPEIRWVTVTDGSRGQGDDTEDRAGKFLDTQNILLVNEDFRGYRDMLDRAVLDNPRVAVNTQGLAVITDIVQAQWEQSLTETVLGVMQLQGVDTWKAAAFSTAVSPEALTAAAMRRIHTEQQVRQSIGNRFRANAGR